MSWFCWRFDLVCGVRAGLCMKHKCIVTALNFEWQAV